MINNIIKQLLMSSSITLVFLLTACTTQDQASQHQTIGDSEATTTKQEPALASTSYDNQAISPRPHSNDDISAQTATTGALALARSPIVKLKPTQISQTTDLRRQRLTDYNQINEQINTENYQHINNNPLKQAATDPVSTFSIDVDTGSYTNVRRFINNGQLPNQDAVRSEELINYFSYDYPQPEANQPFSLSTELAVTPWNSETQLLHIGIKGEQIETAHLPAANLVFLIDVSGSMRAANKLSLLKKSLTLLSKRMRAKDRLSIVVYAGASGVVLKPTAGNQYRQIQTALENLTAGGSTNGAAGIQLAYATAREMYIPDGINRVILATDGDFNVGTVNFEALKQLIEKQRQTGISLTTLGFGTGNYNDKLMEQLADAGNGNYAYIDTLNEAQKVLVEEISSTLKIIAKDVKIQIEFNPDIVAEYRLIGYENRKLEREDFNNDKIDAGDIGAGHTVTALYEISLHGSKGSRIDPLRYGSSKKITARKNIDDIQQSELAFLKLRYKKPDANKSKLIQKPILLSDIKSNINDTSKNYQFSAAVAAFSQQLRGGHYIGNFNYDDILSLATKARGSDRFGYRSEFVRMVNLTKSLVSPVAQTNLPLKSVRQ